MSADAETLKVYAAEADRYADLAATQDDFDGLDGFLGRLAPGARILDLGCGPGHHAARMQAAGFAVIGWDACPGFVEAARDRGVEAHLRVFDDLEATGAFDAIWASFSLLHAPRADLPRHLSAIARALTARGWLYLGMKTGQGEGRDGLGRFYTYVTRPEIEALLREGGFDVVAATEGSGFGLAGTTDPFILLTCRRHD